MRIPLPVGLSARLSHASKDARIVNGIGESKASGGFVLNRPGMVGTGYNYSGTQGILGFNGLLYVVYEDQFEASTYPEPPPPAAIYIGDLVGGYYAMVDEPTTLPGSGDPYWSSAPPGTYRYRALMFVYISEDYITVSKSSTGPFRNQRYTKRAASLDAVTALFEELMSAEENCIGYDSNDGDPYAQFAPNGAYTIAIYRVKPEGTYSHDGVRHINCSGYRLAWTIAKHDWDPVWDPGSVSSSFGGLLGIDLGVATINLEKVKTGVPIYRVGTELRIDFLSLFEYISLKFSYLTRVEISGCDQPEYNGTFDLIPYYDGSSYYPSYLYATVSGTPTTPATGERSVSYYI